MKHHATIVSGCKTVRLLDCIASSYWYDIIFNFVHFNIYRFDCDGELFVAAIIAVY